MKFYVLVDGKLVEATPEQVKDLSVVLYAEDSTIIREAKCLEEDPAKDNDDALDSLTTSVATLAKSVGDFTTSMGKKVTDLEAKVSKGQSFPLFIPDDAKLSQDGKGRREVLDFLDKKMVLSRQGENLKRDHKWWAPKEDVLDEMKCYFGLVNLIGRRYPDPRAYELFQKVYGSEVKTVIGDNGNVFPVPDIVDAEILVFAREASVLLQYARMWDMTSEKQSFPAEDSAVAVGWGNTTAESEPGLIEVELTASELSAYSAVRNSTLADSRSDIVSWLTGALAEAAGQELDNKGFNGLGTDNPFICSGILSAACGYSVVMGSGSTAFSQITSTVLSSMIAKLDGMKKQGARWWLNGAVLHYVRDLKDANGRPIFMETIGSSVPGTIFGYPYTEVIKAPSNSGANTPFIAFGNLRYFAVGRRLQTAALDVNPYLLWTTNRTAYKLYHRWALRMGLPKGFVRLLTAT